MSAATLEERLRDIPFEELVLGLREGGHTKTWNDLFTRILPRVAGAVRRRFPENYVLDAVQSACRTFLSRVRKGRFELGNLDAVASVLVGIANNKCRQMYRRTRLGPLGPGGEGADLDPEDPHPTPLDEAIGREAEADRAVIRDAMASQLEGMLDRVHHLLKEPMHRKVFDRLFEKKYAGTKMTQRAIADEVGCSVRTVRRVWHEIQKEWQPLVEEGQRVIEQLEAELVGGRGASCSYYPGK